MDAIQKSPIGFCKQFRRLQTVGGLHVLIPHGSGPELPHFLHLSGVRLADLLVPLIQVFFFVSKSQQALPLSPGRFGTVPGGNRRLGGVSAD